MAKGQLPIWWPEKPPIYNCEKSYLENLEGGPFFDGTIPQRVLPPREEWSDFLGFPVASSLGVPAGPLLNANWVIFAAKMGFDIVTYKTIRSRPHEAHPLPNMIYVDTKGPLTMQRDRKSVVEAQKPPKHLNDLAATNSFGIPSLPAEYLVADIARANAGLGAGQVMIVSIVGTPRPNENFVKDFADAASIAMAGGAKIIEVDLSCPNVGSREGSLYSNPEQVFEIVSQIKQTIRSIPLVIKVGVFEEQEPLREVMKQAAKAGASAICGINTVSMKIINDKGGSALGKNRLVAGVCGGPIRPAALHFLRHASYVNRQEKLDLTIMGTGGVVHSEHFDLFFKAGADVAMSALGMLWDPYLAARHHGGSR